MGNTTCAQASVESVEAVDTLQTSRPGSDAIPTAAAGNVLSFMLNGKRVHIVCPDPRIMLLEYLRDVQQLTGTKRSCHQGGCGACLVAVQRYDWGNQKWIINTVNSCLKPLVSCDGVMITTVEGVGSERKGCHPIQERFAGNQASQCGFCTPGMVMNAYALLKENGKPTAQQCMDSYDGSTCRCTGYRNIVNVSETFAKDASEEIVDLANRFTPFDANEEKLAQTARPQRPTCKVFQAEDGDVKWYAPTCLAELNTLQLKLNEPMLVLGDLAKCAETPYETTGGKAKDVVFLGNVHELNFVDVQEDELVVGAGMRVQDVVDALLSHADKIAYAKDLAGALSSIAHHSVRSEAGWAGNVMVTCRTGFHSDLVPALIAADAKVTYVSGGQYKQHAVLLQDFVQKDLPTQVLLMKLSIPLKKSGFYRYYRVAQRTWQATALVNGAFYVDVDATTKKVTEARIAIGAYAFHPKRSLGAEESLVGSTLDTATLKKAIEALHRDLDSGFVPEERFRTIDNPAGKDDFRKALPDNFLFKFCQEAQAAYGIKAWKEAELGLMKPSPLKRGKLTFEELPGRENKPQVNAKALTTGQVRYTDDMPVQSYFGYLVLSDCATGTLKSIDAASALQSEGVMAVITAEDIPGSNDSGFFPGEEYLFVPLGGSIQTTGQQIALVVATSYRLAKRAAALVKVDVEGRNVGALTTIDAAIEAGSYNPFAREVGYGDSTSVEDALKNSCDKVITGSSYIIGQHAAPIEKQAACAIPEERTGMTVYSSTQAADFCRKVVAANLGLRGKGSLLTVKCARAGGAFGPKISRNVPVAGAAAVAAHKLEYPVKVALDAEQEQRAVGTRHQFKFEYEVGFKSDGTVQACKVVAWSNAGYTTDWTYNMLVEYTESVPSVYRWGNKFHIRAHGLRTNLPSNTAVRGFGKPQGMFTCETIIEHVANEVGKPVEEVRLANMLTPTPGNAACPWPKSPWGQPMEYFNANVIYEKVKSDAGYTEREAAIQQFNSTNRWRKRGISAVPICFLHSYVYPAGNGALVNINGSDGSVVVHHGGSEIGQGIGIKVAQVAALTLGCDLAAVKVGETNTDVIPNMRFTGGSVTSEVSCEAVRRACLELNETMKPHRDFLKTSLGREPTFPEVAAAANSVLGHRENLSATANFAPMNNRYAINVDGTPAGTNFHGDYWTFGAAVTEVELDILTGHTKVLRADCLFDVGQSINPGVDIGQIEGAFCQGLGYYTQEEPLFDAKGTDRTQGTWGYKVPLASDVPVEFACELLRDNPFPKGVLGSKAVGEPPFLMAYSVLGATKKAIAAARKDAGAPTHFDLPMPCTVDRVQQACAVTVEQMRC